jgi:hypothetical protein
MEKIGKALSSMTLRWLFYNQQGWGLNTILGVDSEMRNWQTFSKSRAQIQDFNPCSLSVFSTKQHQ